jgi:hypothetical protein
MPEQKTVKNRLTPVLMWAMLSVLFALVHTKAILYTSNESTKLLHGVALSGRGFLSKDWIANTLDPLPVFSGLVALTSRFLGDWAYYAYFAALLGVYLYALMGIFKRDEWLGDSRPRLFLFFAFIMVLYSGFLGVVSRAVLHVNVVTTIAHGLANQYLINPLFQNSLFGVLIVLSILVFLRSHPYWAGVILAVTSTFHSAFLFGSAALTVAYMIMLFQEDRNLKRPLILGALTLLLVAPVLVYDKVFLSSTTADSLEQTLDIIVNKRIPQHSLVWVWLTAPSVARIGFMIAGIFLARRTKLFLILGVPFALGTLLSIAQVLTGNLALAMLDPWRVSVFLVPLSLFVIISTAITWAFSRWAGILESKPLEIASVVVVAILALGGLYIQVRDFRADAKSASTALFRFVDVHKTADDLYLVEPKDTRLESFRERTGAPILVNWKSHPYKDEEVMEWYNRVNAAEAFYRAADVPAKAFAVEALRSQYSITHVVARTGSMSWLQGAGAEKIYGNSGYELFRLPAAGTALKP